MAIQRQSGMSLIEMLVAAILLAGGIVGALALQTSANKTTFDAMQRSQAAALADDIIARIRANTQGEAPPRISEVLKYYVTSENTTTIYGDKKIEELQTPSMCNSKGDGSHCDEGAIAKLDLYEWQLKLLGRGVVSEGAGSSATTTDMITSIGLTDPRGCIRISGQLVEVALTWKGRTATLDATDPGNYPSGTFDASSIRAECKIKGDSTSEKLKNRQVYVRAFVF